MLTISSSIVIVLLIGAYNQARVSDNRRRHNSTRRRLRKEDIGSAWR
jgi:hypothetical protein